MKILTVKRARTASERLSSSCARLKEIFTAAQPVGPSQKRRNIVMEVKDIRTASPFNELFPVDQDVLGRVQEHMRDHGYDMSQPVIVWQGTNIVVDGHTRLSAAQNLNLTDIPVHEIPFPSEDEALRYAIHNQRDRRNLTDADIVRLVEVMDKKRQRGGDRRSEEARSKTSDEVIDSPSSKKTADRIGTSRQKVEKVRTILTQAPEDVKREVREGKTSINRAYKEIREGKRNKKAEEETRATADERRVGPGENKGGRVSTQFKIAVENMLSAIRTEKADRWRRTSKEDAFSCIRIMEAEIKGTGGSKHEPVGMGTSDDAQAAPISDEPSARREEAGVSNG
jgi:ParB family chromosome partitioning protein